MILENSFHWYAGLAKSFFIVMPSLVTSMVGFWYKNLTKYPYTNNITAKAIEWVAMKRITAAPDSKTNLLILNFTNNDFIKTAEMIRAMEDNKFK